MLAAAMHGDLRGAHQPAHKRVTHQPAHKRVETTTPGSGEHAAESDNEDVGDTILVRPMIEEPPATPVASPVAPGLTAPAESGGLWCLHDDCTASLAVFGSPELLAAHHAACHGEAAHRTDEHDGEAPPGTPPGTPPTWLRVAPQAPARLHVAPAPAPAPPAAAARPAALASAVGMSLAPRATLQPPPRRVEVQWPTAGVPRAAQKRASQRIVRRGEFGRLTPARMDEVARAVDGVGITFRQAMSLRSALNQETAMRSNRALVANEADVARRYGSGESVAALSLAFDAPPVNVFRAVLRARGWPKARVAHALAHPAQLGNARDEAQLREAVASDWTAPVDSSGRLTAALAFEDDV